MQRLYNSPVVSQSREDIQSLNSFKLNSNVLFGLNDTKTTHTPQQQPQQLQQPETEEKAAHLPDTESTPQYRSIAPPLRGKGKVWNLLNGHLN